MLFSSVWFLIYCMAESSDIEQRISKSSTSRLRSTLVRSGVDEQKVTQMDRAELKDMAAQVETAKRDLEVAQQAELPDQDDVFEKGSTRPPKSSSSSVSNSQEFEMRKLELEMEMRKLELQAQMRDRELEAQTRDKDRDFERERGKLGK